MKSETLRISHELQSMKEKIKENAEKIKVNKTLPYLVSNVIEVCYESYPSRVSSILKNFTHSFKCACTCTVVLPVVDLRFFKSRFMFHLEIKKNRSKGKVKQKVIL